MTYVSQEDGISYLSRGEEYHVTGYVTVRVPVNFYTTSEPDESRFDVELMDALEFDDFEIEDTDGLDFDVEKIEYDGWED